MLTRPLGMTPCAETGTGAHQCPLGAETFPRLSTQQKAPAASPRLSHLPRLLILVTLCTRSRGWSRPPREGSHLVLGRITKLLSVLDLSMPGPPSPNAWSDQEDRPCPRAPWSAILVRQVWRGGGGAGCQGLAWPEDGLGKKRTNSIPLCLFFTEKSETLWSLASALSRVILRWGKIHSCWKKVA